MQEVVTVGSQRRGLSLVVFLLAAVGTGQVTAPPGLRAVCSHVEVTADAERELEGAAQTRAWEPLEADGGQGTGPPQGLGGSAARPAPSSQPNETHGGRLAARMRGSTCVRLCPRRVSRYSSPGTSTMLGSG